MDAALATSPRVGRVPGRTQTIVVLVITAILIGAGAFAIDALSTPDGVTAIQIDGAARALRVGDTLPEFAGTAIDGSRVSIADYAGKPLWLTFGATWCADCRAEAPDIQAAYERYRGQGLALLAISIEEDSATVRTYADRVGLTYPTIADPRNQIASMFGIYGIPTHYFVGRDGIVQEIRIGGLQPGDMDALLGKLLG